MPSMRPWGGALLAVAAALSACTHNVMPKVTPEKVPSVDPRIEARALLLISNSFEQYQTQQTSGVHTWRYHYGEAMTAALTDLVSHSFTVGAVRHVSDAEVLQWLTSTPDSSVADVLLVPYFEQGSQADRVLDLVADARLRLDARTVPGNRTYSWPASGHTARAFTSRKGLSGHTLEQVLRAVSDSLAAHRADLQTGTAVTGR